MRENITFQRDRCRKVVEHCVDGDVWVACCEAYPKLVEQLSEEFYNMPFDDGCGFCNRRNIIKELLGLTEQAIHFLENTKDRREYLRGLL